MPAKTGSRGDAGVQGAQGFFVSYMPFLYKKIYTHSSLSNWCDFDRVLMIGLYFAKLAVPEIENMHAFWLDSLQFRTSASLV